MAEFSYNSHQNASTGKSPFETLWGSNPWKGEATTRISSNESADKFHQKMQEVRENVKLSLDQAAEHMKISHDRKITPKNLKVGQKVWLEGSNLKTTRPTAKLSDRRHGPFLILEDLGRGAYKLKLPETWKIHPVFHENLLTPYQAPGFENQKKKSPAPPDLIEGEEEWEVETILDSRKHRKTIEYLIKWKDYPQEENTWESRKNLSRASD